MIRDTVRLMEKPIIKDTLKYESLIKLVSREIKKNIYQQTIHQLIQGVEDVNRTK